MSMMSSTMRTSSPSIEEERSLRMRTWPDVSVAPPYEETSMRSMRTGSEMERIRSAMKGRAPLRTLTRVTCRSW